MKEFGSEFWSVDETDNTSDFEILNLGKDQKLFMSGRTSVDYILSDIDDSKKIVYMPNYCCESMIKPFEDNGYKISYYTADVINNKYDIDINFDCSIFYAISYFGYNISNMDDYIEKFAKRNIIVLEDITHRLLCDKNHCTKSTYLTASLRKWFPIISGAIAINMNNNFKNSINNYEINEKFVKLKEKAMNLKKDYIENNSDTKKVFLELYNQANHMIEDYRFKKIDNKSINILKKLNIESIKNTRINNCKLIEKKLRNNKNIKLLYKYNQGDCPLFVPIILNNRDDIRKKLTTNNIYLPIHWPNKKNINNDIYDLELSLINDQRYTEKDIEIYIDKLIEIAGDYNERHLF